MLTTPILTTVQAWIEADGIDWESYRTVMRAWVTDAYGPNGTRNPVHALERGECSDAEFEQALAAQLLRVDGGSVLAAGLLQRMFAASVEIPAMYELIRAVRAGRVADRAAVQLLGRHRVPAGGLPAPVRRRGDLQRVRHAQAGGGDLPARGGPAGPAAGAVHLHRRHRGEHNRGAGLRHDRRAPRRGGADGGGRSRTSSASRSPEPGPPEPGLLGRASRLAGTGPAGTGPAGTGPATGNTMR